MLCRICFFNENICGKDKTFIRKVCNVDTDNGCVGTLTLEGGHDLACGHPEAPLAGVEAGEEGGGEAEGGGQHPRHAQVQDKQVPRVPVSSLASNIETSTI